LLISFAIHPYQVSRSGYLLKKGGSKKERSALFGRKNWKRRFFYLDGATSQLAYYKVRQRVSFDIKQGSSLYPKPPCRL
jgi:hypothetical protein